jgi:hypothetical protein
MKAILVTVVAATLAVGHAVHGQDLGGMCTMTTSSMTSSSVTTSSIPPYGVRDQEHP